MDTDGITKVCKLFQPGTQAETATRTLARLLDFQHTKPDFGDGQIFKIVI